MILFDSYGHVAKIPTWNSSIRLLPREQGLATMHLSPPFPANGFEPAAATPGGFFLPDIGALHIDTKVFSMHHPVKIYTLRESAGDREPASNDRGFFFLAWETDKKKPTH